MNRQREDTNLSLKMRVGLCPTCGEYTQFNFLGEQHWPPRVVEATGMGPVVHLWLCGSCQTTLTETYMDSQG